MDRTQINRVSVADQVAALLRQQILEGEFRPGTQLQELPLRDVQEIYQLRRMLELPAVLAARRPDPGLLQEIRNAVEQYELAVRDRNWSRAVSHDLHFHSLLIHFHGNKRLESFYKNMLGELRVGMVLVDRSHDNPGALIPVHRKMCQLLSAGKLKQCAALLEQHLEDSESRLTQIMHAHATRVVRTAQ